MPILQHARRNIRARFVMVAFVSVSATIACSGGDSTPSVPSPSPSGPSGGGTCRTYATAADVTTTSLGVTMNAKVTGAFNASTNQSTVTTLFANGATCSTTVGIYRSTADFVDEVRVIPGVFLVTSTTTTNSAACGGGSATTTYSYDSQRRLTQTTSIGGTTTWTAWDSSGRPTNGSSPGVTYVQVYDDAARTQTGTTTNSSGASVGKLTFDANGIQIRNEVTGASGASVTTFATTATDKVCK